MLASSKTLDSFQMAAGDYEFPFTIPLSSNILETITGPNHEYHTYRVEAVLERRFRKDLIVSRPVKLYSTPNPDMVNMTQSFPMAVEGLFSQNIQYSISMPDQNIPFGSTFLVECWFAPLSKSIKLCALTIEVIEKHYLRFDATARESVRDNIRYVTSAKNHTVFTQKEDVTDEASSAETEWRIKQPVSLPKSLQHCSQSISTQNIKIGHALVIIADFQDGQGLVSTKVMKEISFNIHMAASVIEQSAIVPGQDFNLLVTHGSPPPSYGKHTSDLIFANLPEIGALDHPVSNCGAVPICFRFSESPPCYEQLGPTDP
ncbi:hypothetical protein N7510_000011 [Penicillium lagena]|uniref:uncharacterized protein n=1 Tax=Penicillium lagena TaxID=94218 RepID=UPI0025413848|nr:uncharacterized protein N7510_011834 [Penicillium lagena]XP_056837058.1 uncharacterized protein N7510_000011 [Penicillium lagena]KAJ5598884.1 hypothetical protein N7510_011834 [Penicillium lagena]KAJ5623702.1 hypothetical protein N7510_000011 [Penicillium lagena]